MKFVRVWNERRPASGEDIMEVKEEGAGVDAVLEQEVAFLRFSLGGILRVRLISEPWRAAEMFADLRDRWGSESAAFVCGDLGAAPRASPTGWRCGWRMKVVLGIEEEAFVEKDEGDRWLVVVFAVREGGEVGWGMNEGSVPPRLLGGVTNASALRVGREDLGGDVSVKWAGLDVVGRGIEDGDMGRGIEDGDWWTDGGVDVATVVPAFVELGCPKLKGTAASSSSSSSSSKK
jgi:hypothetical protein